MDCHEARTRLVELADGELEGPDAISCREHVATCGECARELELHKKTWALLGTMEREGASVGRERLERMADAALAEANAPGDGSEPESSVPTLTHLLSSRGSRIAAAAALLLAVTLGAKFMLRGSRPGLPGTPPGALEHPACLDDPEFVMNFDVIRDLPDLDVDGELLDVEDDVLMLQALEGA